MSTSTVSTVLRYLSTFRGPVAGTPGVAADVRAGVADLGGSVRWLKETFYDTFLGAPQQIIGRSGNQLEVTANGLASNTPVRVFATSGGSLPAGLSADTVYYVRDVAGDDVLELSATAGPGSAVSLSSDGSGDQWIQPIPDWISTVMIASSTYGYGKFKDLIMWLAGTQTVSGAKTFSGTFTIGGTNLVNYASRGRTRVAHVHATNSALDTVLGVPFTLPSGQTWDIALSIPNGAVVTSLTVYINPETHAALPATMPTFRLRRATLANVIDNRSDLFTDSSADEIIYSAAHTVTINTQSSSALAETIDNSLYSYHIRVTGEASTNADDMFVTGVAWAGTISSQDDAR